MHQNTVKQTETLVWGPTRWIGCVRCEKSRCDFAAPTFTLIAPVHPVLNRVSCIYETIFSLVAPVQYVLQQGSCSYETIPNAPKYYETDRNFSSGSNGVDEVRLLRKITT